MSENNNPYLSSMLQCVKEKKFTSIPCVIFDYFVTLTYDEIMEYIDRNEFNSFLEYLIINEKVYDVVDFEVKRKIAKRGKISCGMYHSVAIGNDGTIKMFGQSDSRQRLNFPESSKFDKVACGDFHTIGLKKNKTVRIWGQFHNWQNYGNIWNSFDIWSTYDRICAGKNVSFAIKNNGKFDFWGLNATNHFNEYLQEGFLQIEDYFGMSGILTSDNRAIIWNNSEKYSIDNVTQIAIGGYFGVVILKDGTLRIFGTCSSNQKLDFPDDNSRYIQVEVGLQHGIALREDGIIIPFGCNKYGQRDNLPDGKFLEIACGQVHSMGLREDGEIFIWGNNRYDQRNL